MATSTLPSTSAARNVLPYNPKELPRELARHYIPAEEDEIAAMLEAVDVHSLDALYGHIDNAIKFRDGLGLPEELDYDQLLDHLQQLSAKNHARPSFQGDGLAHWHQPEIVRHVLSVRNLGTSYTPYQPERSQGTLMSHWIFQCALSMLTGFEAINSSLYDRSTAIYEAICTALRLKRKADTVLIPDSLYPGDIDVLETLANDTATRLERLPMDLDTGSPSLSSIQARLDGLGENVAAVVYPQVNNFGALEDVDAITDTIHARGALAIAVVDPLLLATGGLKRPVDYGEKGADMIVGEGQHLALEANFGGPGLGLFGVRFNENNKNAIRQTPGRYVGKGHDMDGRECRVMVMSTREQHIRKDKATSNICSNQAFIATLAGASLLGRGDTGLNELITSARDRSQELAAKLTAFDGVELAFPGRPFFNEVTLVLPEAPAALIEAGREADLHAGVDVSSRDPNGRHLLKISVTNAQNSADEDKLIEVFQSRYGVPKSGATTVTAMPQNLRRAAPAGLPEIPYDRLAEYYTRLGKLNVGPEDAIFPLGSCTMKYNPYINEWAAGLPGFSQLHPQAPLKDAQGSLEIIYETQEWFKKITGLPGVTTQPVAGAQGELTGIKMFQAYHRSRGETQRDTILIPKSAHGTNFATAIMAGYPTKKVAGRTAGIALLDNDETGQIDMEQLDRVLAEHQGHVAGIMVTNPNTGGLFETRFKEVAERIHAAGGLVYMDGANMNAIAGRIDLNAMGVDAVHNNTHKTWTIPHGGGGPGDAFVGVSEPLLDFMPGMQVIKHADGTLEPVRPRHSIGSLHRHWGQFAHKVRCYTYLRRLGNDGIPRMSAMAVLAARYLYERLKDITPVLPKGAGDQPRMHEFILTVSNEDFEKFEAAGIPKAQVMPSIGKLFLDFGYHAPTVAFPEPFGLMIEPTESFTKAELDRFADATEAILGLVRKHPEVLKTAPHFTPINRVDEVGANRALTLFETLEDLPELPSDRTASQELLGMEIPDICEKILIESPKQTPAF